MYINLLHILKWSKSFMIRPSKTIKWFLDDFKKDTNSSNFKSKYHNVWCAGLPKSGTTLIEKILSILPYVSLNNSLLRVFNSRNLDHEHGISNKMFEKLNNKEFTFLKTHTHYEKKYEDIARSNNLKIIVSVRDLRDMLISRYFHILSDSDHWLHHKIKNKDFTEGFILSLNSKYKEDLPNALNYYYYWILEWHKVAKKNNYLILWYEDYKNNPLDYIDRVLRYLNFKEFSTFEIKDQIVKAREKEKTLKTSLREYGRSKDTFRKGKVEEWKKYFNKEVLNYFNENIPDKIEKISYEYLKKHD